MTKKELLVLKREKDKLDKTLGGIRDMAKVPSAVWIVDTNKEHIAVAEAKKLGIPVVAILDSNCDPDVVDFPIPGNDDAIRAVSLLTRVIADAVADGLMARAGRGGAAAEAGRGRRSPSTSRSPPGRPSCSPAPTRRSRCPPALPRRWRSRSPPRLPPRRRGRGRGPSAEASPRLRGRGRAEAPAAEAAPEAPAEQA